jgi:hypothetical protein
VGARVGRDALGHWPDWPGGHGGLLREQIAEHWS